MDNARLTVRELGRDLPVGGSRSGLVCPKCNGGRSGERSLSVYRTEYGIGGRCHRDKCGLNLFRSALTPAPDLPAPFTPRPYPHPLVLPAPDHPAWDRLHAPPAARTPATAARLGLLTRGDDLTETVWEIRDYNWTTKGHVSRTYPGKVIRTWKTTEGPWYGYFGFNRTPTLWIVEDPVSASRIALAGGNAVALLSTHFSSASQSELGAYLRRLAAVAETPQIKVALDPDATGTGVALTRELTNRLGCATMLIPMVADPKDLSDEDFNELMGGG